MRAMPMLIQEEIREALANHQPIVALESTVIAHGLPFPQNICIAKELEQAVREEGAIPAMIALREGFVRVGLLADDLELLAHNKAPVRKVSRRDIAFTLASKSIGATTVSATMALAHLAGIKIFATGGIGGVHRGAEHTMDISADLYELSTTPVAVICAGAKSILDLSKTLEVLESLGVPLWGYCTNFLPEFFCAGMRHALDMSFSCEQQLAEALNIHWSLGFNTGVVIAQNVPHAEALKPDFVDALIENALAKAYKNHIQGKALTPFLLKDLADNSQGQSLTSNKALLLENARLASRIAVAQMNAKLN